jgi:hypothetical protein
VAGELGRRGRLARTLEADYQHDRRRAIQPEGAVAHAQDPGQLLVHDLDHLLAGVQALEHLRAHGALPHASHEVLDHAEVDVGLQEGESHLAQRGIHVGFADAAAAGEAAEHVAQAAGKLIEHG